MLHWSVVASLTFITVFADSTLGQVSPPETSTQIRKEFVLGRQLAGDLERADGSIDDPAIVGYLQGIADRVASAARGKALELRITQGFNRYARLLPDGALYISSSLLERLENEAELAGLLAHQLAHVHGTIASAHIQPATGVILPSCVLASQMVPARWSESQRESELLATKTAVETLREAGYDPSAVLDLLSKLAYEHPAWAMAIFPEDLLNLRATLEIDVPPSNGYKIDSSAFREQHARVVAAVKHSVSRRTAPSLTSLLPR